MLSIKSNITFKCLQTTQRKNNIVCRNNKNNNDYNEQYKFLKQQRENCNNITRSWFKNANKTNKTNNNYKLNKPVYKKRQDGWLIRLISNCSGPLLYYNDGFYWNNINDDMHQHKRSIIIYTCFEQAENAYQHLIEQYGECFVLDKVNIDDVIKSCRTSSAHVKVIGSDYITFYQAHEQCCDEVRTVFEYLFKNK